MESTYSFWMSILCINTYTARTPHPCTIHRKYESAGSGSKLHPRVAHQGPHCIKLTIDGNFAINGNYHGHLDFDWLFSPVAMVVAIDDKVTINDKFFATGPRAFWGVLAILIIDTHFYQMNLFRLHRIRY